MFISIDFDHLETPVHYRLDERHDWTQTPFVAADFFTGDMLADTDRALERVDGWLQERGIR